VLPSLTHRVTRSSALSQLNCRVDRRRIVPVPVRTLHRTHPWCGYSGCHTPRSPSRTQRSDLPAAGPSQWPNRFSSSTGERRLLASKPAARQTGRSVSSKPRSASRCRSLSTVLVRHENASAMRSSVQFGPSASAFSRIWAHRTFWAVPFIFLITPRSSLRSRSVSRTMYLFCMADLLVPRRIADMLESTNPTF